MSVVSAEKIFLDSEEEINFIIHKIQPSPKERVIIVVPREATILRSLISIKILAKQILKSKKLMVIVTEDGFGRRLANRAGLVSVNKVSDVTQDIWEKAQLNKERDLELLERHEKRLIGDRQIPEIEKKEDKTTESLETDIKVELEEVADTPEEQSNEELIIPEKKKLPPKTVQIAGLTICSGGDISDVNKEEVEKDKVSDIDEVEIPEGRIPMNYSAKLKSQDDEFVGKDWTRVTKNKKPRPKWMKKPKFTIFKNIFKPSAKKILFPVLIFVVILLAVPYIFIINAFVVVDITLKTTDVNLEEVITATQGVELNTDELIIPALVIDSEEVGRSTTSQASGSGQTGEIASGSIDLYNHTCDVVTIDSGTKVSSIITGLSYVIQETAEINSAADCDTGGVERYSNVSVRAEKFGEEYNIEGASQNTAFEVEGYANTEVSGLRFRNFEGGTTREITVVSEQDIEGTKESLLRQVEEAAIAQLNNEVPNGYILLEGSQEFEELEVMSSPDVEEQATNFDVSLTGKATAIAIAEEDLQTIARELATRSQGGNGEFDFGNLDLPDFTEIKRDGNSVTFKIFSSGKLQSKVSTEIIQDQIVGTDVKTVSEYLDALSEVESYEINYSASFLPTFVQLIPEDPDRVKVRIR